MKTITRTQLNKVRQMIQEVVSDRTIIQPMLTFMKSNRPKVNKPGERNEYDLAIATRMLHLMELAGSRTMDTDKEYSIRLVLERAIPQMKQYIQKADSQFKIKNDSDSYLSSLIYKYIEDQKPEDYKSRPRLDQQISDLIVQLLAIGGSRTDLSDRAYHYYRQIYKLVDSIESKFDQLTRTYSHGGGYSDASSDFFSTSTV